MAQRLEKHFKIVKTLGKGSYGVAYQVERYQDGKSYALKQTDIKALPPHVRRHVVNEVRLLASLNHPHIVKYYEAFVDSGNNVCLVMELLHPKYAALVCRECREASLEGGVPVLGEGAGAPPSCARPHSAAHSFPQHPPPNSPGAAQRARCVPDSRITPRPDQARISQEGCPHPQGQGSFRFAQHPASPSPPAPAPQCPPEQGQAQGKAPQRSRFHLPDIFGRRRTTAGARDRKSSTGRVDIDVFTSEPSLRLERPSPMRTSGGPEEKHEAGHGESSKAGKAARRRPGSIVDLFRTWMSKP